MLATSQLIQFDSSFVAEVLCSPSSHSHAEVPPPQSSKSSQPEAHASDDDDDEEYTEGQFVIVKYEEKPYVGQIVEILSKNELKVNCMEQKGSQNAFVWPQRRDCICFNRNEIVCSLEQPEQCKRFVMLSKCDWLIFNDA